MLSRNVYIVIIYVLYRSTPSYSRSDNAPRNWIAEGKSIYLFQNKGKNKKKKKTNLRQAPFHLQDGDILGIKVKPGDCGIKFDLFLGRICNLLFLYFFLGFCLRRTCENVAGLLFFLYLVASWKISHICFFALSVLMLCAPSNRRRPFSCRRFVRFLVKKNLI